ncbi:MULTISPECIES: tripartite tricarboxylate transporter substrate binding protein [Kocuria]|uniref:tripartite tricarboxylate transporter substrate binding protein n=1 Tax=Kocuria TaxID=57493 RepID=UPI000738DB28|nr:tripartite tricarboxylate transporter substrate-binding protein [Kocuria palustris]KUG55247.1 tricarboxylic transporter [Kocuria palustris]
MEAQETSQTGPPGRRAVLKGLGAVVALGSFGTAAYGSITSRTSGTDLRSNLTIIAPAAAGGGWDTIAREMQMVQRENQIINNTQVVNQPGAGGTIALSNLINMEGDPQTLMVGGTGQLAATIQYETEATLDDVTPLAVVVEEYGVIVVPGDSPYESLDDLVKAWKDDPGALPWTGGGSFDELVITDLALKAGVDLANFQFVSSDGGGEAIQALLNGTAKAATGGYPDNVDQIEAGNLRALALVAPEPVEGIDIPTAVDQGYDVSLTNWRLLAAPPGITDEEKAELEDVILETIDAPEWAEAVERYHWSENRIFGDELTDFLETERERISGLYEEMGS